jgi:hypothetical protein
MILGCDFQSDMLLRSDKCILTCCNWYFIHILGIFQQGVGGSFGWYLLIFANGVGWMQKCGNGWWLWLSKPWIIIKWSTFVWMPQALRLKNDILNFGPCQKKHDGKYCGYQNYLGLQETEKIVLAVCIIETSIKNHLLLLFRLCAFK